MAAEPAAAHSAPQGHYIFRSYGPADGLVNTTVTQLLQDAHGFIWAGTDDGLYRYDGYRFDLFNVKHGLITTDIQALHEDSHGGLWVGTRGGLSRWNGVSFMSLPGVVGPDDRVRGIADDAGGLWVAATKGLLRAGSDLQFRTAPGWSGGEATALMIGRQASGIWAARWDGRPHVQRFEGAQWLDYPLGGDVAAERIDAIVEDGAGQVWVRSSSQLWMLDARRRQFEAVEAPAPLNADIGYLSVGRHGDLWVSSNERVLHRVGKQWTEVLGGPVLGTRPVLEDREGSLWFGTRGLQRLAGRGVFHAYDMSEGLPGNVAWSLARGRDRTLWVGTEHGLTRAVGERFEIIPGTESYVIRTIAVADDGVLYLGGIPGTDILRFDPRSGALKHLDLGPNPPVRVLHSLIDAQGTLWATTDTAGLLKADTHDPAPHFVREPLPDASPQEFLRGIDLDADARLWVASHAGLLLRENSKWRRFSMNDGLRQDQLEYVRVAHNGDLLVAYSGTNGFDRLRYTGGTLRVLKHFEFGSTRYVDSIFIVGEDAQDDVWIGTGRGIDRYTPAGVEHFGAQHGLVGEDTASMAFLADANGDVWFGVVGGLMHFDAAKYASLPKRAPPPAQLVDVHLGEQPFSADARDLQAQRPKNAFQVRFASPSFAGDGGTEYRTRLEGLEASAHVTESREAHYSALPPGDYRFEVAARSGASGMWGVPATIAFKVLPAWWQTWWARVLLVLGAACGVLLVVRWRLAALQERNRLLEENIAARTAELTRSNRLLIAEIGDRVRAETQAQQRNAELEQLNHRLAGTQSQLLQSEKMASVGQLAAGVAHEINNPIGFVQSNLNSLTQYIIDIFEVLRVYEHLEPALPGDHPELMQLRLLKQRIDLEFLRRDTNDLLTETLDGVTRVKKIVKDLKDFSRIDEAEWQRVDLHQSLDSTLNVVAHELKYKADLVKQYGALPPIECLPFQINQVFLNLLVNAVQAIEGRGRIVISSGSDAEQVWVSIADNGKGIEPGVLHRIFEPFFTTKPVGVGTGLGLSVSYGIVQNHGGSIEVESTVGSGTTFTVRLPIQSKREALRSVAESTPAPEFQPVA